MNVACLGAFIGTITAQTNSTARITFTVTSGALPTGLSMTSSGKVATIAGTITAVGTFTFVVRATLATGEYAAAQYVVYVAAVANDELDDGAVGDLYSNTLTIAGPTEGASTWSVVSGSLPSGLSLNASTGEISGTPTTEADYSFMVRFTNALTSCTKAFTVSIGASLFCGYISENDPPDGVVDDFYSYTLIYTGPVTFTEVWSLASGTLPTGLSIGSVMGHPTLLGLPSADGLFSFSLTLTSDLGACTIPLTIDIAPIGCGLNSNTPPSSNVGASYSYGFTFSGVPSGTATWSVASGSLPAGLSLNSSTGVLSGTPTTSASYVFAIRYVDSGTDCTSSNFNVGIFPMIICPDLADVEWLGFIQNGGTFSPTAGSHSLTFSANATAAAFADDYFVQGTASVPYVTNQYGCRIRIVGTVTFTGAVPADDADQFCEYVLFDSGNSHIAASGSFLGRFGSQPIDISFDLPTTPPVGQYRLLISIAANSVAGEVRSSQFDGTISLA